MSANLFLSLPVPAGDGVGAWVDTSGLAASRTLALDGGSFAGSIVVEASNDGQASAAPIDGVPIFNSGSPNAVTFTATLQFMRVRRTGASAGPAGTPSVQVGGEQSTTNIFSVLPVLNGDGAAASVSLAGGGAINTFNVVGSFTGQVAIEISNDGVNFSPALLFTAAGAVGKTFVGVVSAVRVRRIYSTGGAVPAVSVGSGGSGPGGGEPPIVLLPNQFVVACVDYDGRVLAGNDATAAPGVSTDLATAIAAAKLTPFKTYERVAQVVPGFGNGATLYVMGKGRVGGISYRNIANTADQGADWRNGFTQWRRISLRSTGDFSDTTFDRIQAGFAPAAGTSATGYNATAGATNNTIPCQLAGGGAANLPAEAVVAPFTSTITGYRIRFDPNTVTATLRNVCGMVWKNTVGQIIVSNNLPAVPVTGNAGDVFYIETTELQFGSPTCLLGAVQANWSIADERYTASGTVTGGTGTIPVFAACESTAVITFTRMETISVFINWFDPLGTAFGVGTGGRWAAGGTAMNVSDIVSAAVSNVGIANGALSIIGAIRLSGLGQASVIATGINDSAASGVGSNSIGGSQPPRSIGNPFSSATSQRLRITSNGAFGAAILCNATGYNIRAVDIANQATALIALGAGTVTQGQQLAIDDIVSTDGGNTGTVLSLSAAQNATVRWGLTVANTATAARDVDLAGGVTGGTFAGLANSNYWDSAGNNLVGSAGVVMDKPGKAISNQTSAVAQGQIIRSNATSGQGTIAQADTAAHAAGILGVAVTAGAAGATVLIASPGSHAAVLFDASAPVAGGIAYLSTGTAGDAQSGIPAVAATNQKNRLGIVRVVAGSFGLLSFEPDKLAVLADGAA